MRNKWLLFILFALPVMLMIGVNETAHQASYKWNKATCTRYCHDHDCSHGASFKASYPIFNEWYQANMRILKHNPFGLSYAAANIGLYVIFVPFMSLFFLWGLIRKGNN